MLLNISGTEKHQRLGDRMEEHVKHCAKRAQLTAESQTRDNNSSVINAGIREDAPKIALGDDEGRSDQNGNEAEGNK